jgi:hypothetical protein
MLHWLRLADARARAQIGFAAITAVVIKGILKKQGRLG